MRIGLVELLLILLIASLTIGPSAALWVDRWMRRAQKTSAAAARRRAAQEAQRAAEREEVLQRFQKLSIVFVLCAAVALIWGLVLRPIEAAPTPYTAPDVRQETGAQPPPKAAFWNWPPTRRSPPCERTTAGSTPPPNPARMAACCGCSRTAPAGPKC